MNTFRLYEQLKAAFPKESAEALARVLSEVTEELQNTVTKSDFAELKAAVRELAEAQKRTEETMRAGFLDLHHRFGVLGSRWGDRAEETFRRGLLETVRGVGYKVEHYHGQDPEGFINHRPRSFDLDVLIRNGEVVVAEIKSNASGADVTEFHRSVLLYEQQTGRRAGKRILVAVTLQEAALERARELGIIVATDFAPLIERT
jgi:hypothetical protein